MIKIVFYQKKSIITGFEAKGHSMSAPKGEDIVCAFVSSACLMAANTVTEILSLNASAESADGFLNLKIFENAEKAGTVLEGLRLHLTELEKDYPKSVQVTNSEV